MSRRRDIDTRLASLDDIGKIMGSMKNLSLMEARKLTRFIGSQAIVTADIRDAALDLLDHHPDLLPSGPGGGTLYTLIGAERGFCGAFSEAVRDALAARPADEQRCLVVVGRRLGNLLEDDPALAEVLPGASAAQDVPRVLRRLSETLQQLGEVCGRESLVVIHWDAQTDTVICTPLLPPWRRERPEHHRAGACPPLLHLPPAELFTQLVEHYLLAALHASLYSSLLAEHQQRVRHLEGALDRIDHRIQGLRQQRNLLRQEEITEEIELILLNLQGGGPTRGQAPETGD